MRKLFFVALCVISISGSAQTPSYVPTNGLIGWWPFNGNANDESGNGNHGTVNGATLTTDRLGNTGKAYGFDGVTNRIQVILTNPLINNTTISVWYFSTFLKGGPFVHIGQDNGSATFCNGYNIGKGGSTLNDSGNDLISGFSCIGYYDSHIQAENSRWNHAVLIKIANQIKFYLNGNLVSTQSTIIPIAPSPFIFFASTSQGFSTLFNGTLDDIAIYNRALTPQEINSLYRGCTTQDSSSFSANGCNVYTLPWGDTVTASGSYTHTYTNANGCDSIVTANITVNNHEVGASVNVSGTGSYALPWGDTARNSGYYTHVYQNQFGCDSLVTYYVVVNQPSSSTQPNVGINVQNPQRALHVNDAIRLEPRNTPLENPTKGDMYFDGTTDKLRIYDGRAWRDAY